MNTSYTFEYITAMNGPPFKRQASLRAQYSTSKVN